jgi:hypothetical protein
MNFSLAATGKAKTAGMTLMMSLTRLLPSSTWRLRPGGVQGIGFLKPFNLLPFPARPMAKTLGRLPAIDQSD